MNNIEIKNNLNYYQDWVKLFSLIKIHGLNNEFYLECVAGELLDKEYTLIYFKEELLEIINYCLKKDISRFIRDMNLLLEFNDIYSVTRKLCLLKKSLYHLQFFKKLSFLDEKFRMELTKSFNENVNDFYYKFRSNIRKKYSDNQEMIELYYMIQKFKI